MLSKIIADDIVFLFHLFPEKIRLGIPCDSSVCDDSYDMSSYFLGEILKKKKKRKRMSSAAIVIDVSSVGIHNWRITG